MHYIFPAPCIDIVQQHDIVLPLTHFCETTANALQGVHKLPVPGAF